MTETLVKEVGTTRKEFLSAILGFVPATAILTWVGYVGKNIYKGHKANIVDEKKTTEFYSLFRRIPDSEDRWHLDIELRKYYTACRLHSSDADETKAAITEKFGNITADKSILPRIFQIIEELVASKSSEAEGDKNADEWDQSETLTGMLSGFISRHGGREN